MTDRFLTLSEVRRLLSVSRATLWRWTAERGLRVVTVGNVTRIRESDLEAFLKRHETNGADGATPETPGTTTADRTEPKNSS
jgi:excisionase family DNA binding protein